MEIHGLQKLTLLDYPGRTACTVFTGRCNYRCPFCHNGALVLAPESQPALPEEEILRFLEKRRRLLDGVAVTGGEPTLQEDLPAFLRRVKDLGYAVKLDTNGTRPGVLRALLGEGLVDYVAMDVKAAPEKYAAAVGLPACDLAPVRESAALLMEGAADFEFRTTVVEQLHTPEDFDAVGRWLRGEEKYFLQAFRDSGDQIRPGMKGCSRERMQAMLERLRLYVPRAELRGVD